MRIFIISLCLVCASFLTAGDDVKLMDYSLFIEHLRNGKVSAVSFHNGGMMAEFHGTTTTNSFVIRERKQSFNSDPLLQEELQKAKIEPTYKPVASMTPWQRGTLIGTLIWVLMWLLLPVTILILVIINNRRLKKLIEKS